MGSRSAILPGTLDLLTLGREQLVTAMAAAIIRQQARVEVRSVHWILGVVANLFGRSRLDRDLHDEIAFHIESRIADLSTRGLPPEEPVGVDSPASGRLPARRLEDTV